MPGLEPRSQAIRISVRISEPLTIFVYSVTLKLPHPRRSWSYSPGPIAPFREMCRAPKIRGAPFSEEAHALPGAWRRKNSTARVKRGLARGPLLLAKVDSPGKDGETNHNLIVHGICL